MPPIHNAIKYGTSILRAYSRGIGLGEDEEGTVRLGETLTPVLDQWERPEFAFLRGDRLCGGDFRVTSGAGTLCEILLLNRATSRHIGVITRLHFRPSTAQIVRYARLNSGVLPAGFVQINTGPLDFRDPQIIAVPGTALTLNQAANAAIDGGIDFDEFDLAALARFEDREPIIVGPGTGFLLRQSVVGVNTLSGGIRWTEIPLQPGARSAT